MLQVRNRNWKVHVGLIPYSLLLVLSLTFRWDKNPRSRVNRLTAPAHYIEHFPRLFCLFFDHFSQVWSGLALTELSATREATLGGTKRPSTLALLYKEKRVASHSPTSGPRDCSRQQDFLFVLVVFFFLRKLQFLLLMRGRDQEIYTSRCTKIYWH